MVPARLIVDLYPGDAIVSPGKYFTPPFENDGEFSESIVTEKVGKSAETMLPHSG